MQDAQHAHRFRCFEDFVDGNEWQGRKRDFTRALDATYAPEVRELLQSADSIDDGFRNSSCSLGTALRNVVADPLEVVGGIRRPTDVHYPR